MHIRKLSADELEILTELFDYKDIDNMLFENRRKINSGDIDIFCLFNDSRLIGELRVKYTNNDSLFAVKGKRAYLYAFRIHNDFQGMGLGKQLLENVIMMLKNQGYTEFTVGVEDNNECAKHIYNKFGFNKLLARRKEEYQGDVFEYNLYLKGQK